MRSKFGVLLAIIFIIQIVPMFTEELSWKAIQDSTEYYCTKSDFSKGLVFANRSLIQCEKEFGRKDTNYLNKRGGDF